jgi:hypothetical protein
VNLDDNSPRGWGGGGGREGVPSLCFGWVGSQSASSESFARPLACADNVGTFGADSVVEGVIMVTWVSPCPSSWSFWSRFKWW